MFEELNLSGVVLITPKKHGDDRGFFSETYNASTWERAGLDFRFVQDNHSLSCDVGTVRGLHFQTEPFAQDKLVRVVRGRILDVVVDLRKSSRTFGQHLKVELSRENWKQLLVPKGFAHGFVTLEPDTEVVYKVTNIYAPAHDRGLAWDDPDLEIDWGVGPERATLSGKDQNWPRLRDLGEVFS